MNYVIGDSKSAFVVKYDEAAKHWNVSPDEDTEAWGPTSDWSIICNLHKNTCGSISGIEYSFNNTNYKQYIYDPYFNDMMLPFLINNGSTYLSSVEHSET